MTEFKSPLDPAAAEGRRDVAGADPSVLRRDDFVAAVAGYRRDSRAPLARAAVPLGFLGLIVAVVLISLSDRLGWPAVFPPIFFVGGWLALLASFGVVWRRELRLRARYQVHCPRCGKPLVDSTVSRRGDSHADQAIATGHCPYCGAHILAP